MRVSIQNIGVIDNSHIQVDGLTVITGKNNSGKTTFGKVLYSLFSAKENLFENATIDVVEFVNKQIPMIIRNSSLSYFFRRAPLDHANFNEDLILLINAYKDILPEQKSIDESIAFIKKFIDIVDNLRFQEIQRTFTDKNVNSKFRSEEDFLDATKELIEELSSLIDNIKTLINFDTYESIKIYNTLNREFSKQISPVRLPDAHFSRIQLYSTNDTFDVIIDNKEKKINTNGYFGFEDINNVIFIDDVTVLDNVNPHFSDFLKRRRSIYQGEKLDDYVFTLDHKFALINKLSKVSDIINSIIENQTLERLLGKISKIVPDDIVVRDSLFVCSSDGLNLSNLAMGTKLFAIIKMLLSNGSLNSKTLLILDEPESHLHPMWQNIIAEIIVLLIKELGIKVIITSHSPNFVLALHTFAIKHCLLNITNFYYTEKKTDGYLVDYIPMNSDLSKVYAEFSKPFSQMKAIFDSLQLGDDND